MRSSERDVKRGVILAAGYGTRFLPVTKTIPKEMLPIIDVPGIEYIVREFTESGISKILIVTSRRKKALEDYFDREIELEGFLALNKKNRLKEKLPNFNVDFSYIRQDRMLGTGNALMLAEDFTRAEPFVVAYPDDIVISKTPLTSRLILAFKNTGKMAIALEQIPSIIGCRYGVVTTQKGGKNSLLVKKIVEKPKLKKDGCPFDGNVMISLGRYLFTPDIFDVLRENGKKGSTETCSQTDMLNHFAKNNDIVGVEMDGIRYDLGQPDGYVKAITHAALNRSDIKEDYMKYLRLLCKG